MRNSTALKSRTTSQSGFSLLEIIMVFAIMMMVMMGAMMMTEVKVIPDSDSEHTLKRVGRTHSDDHSLKEFPSKPPLAQPSRNMSNQDIF